MDGNVKLMMISYHSFKTTLCTFSDKRLFGQRLGMNRWHSSYANVFSFEPWQDWLLCDFIGKAEAANKVVISEVPWAHWRVLCRIQLHSVFFCRFFASGCSLLKKGIACKIKPFSHLQRQNTQQKAGEKPDRLADSDNFFARISVSGWFFLHIWGSRNCSGW